MINSACYLMKKAILTALLLMAVGGSLEVLAIFLPEHSIYHILLVYLGFFSIFASLITIVSTFIAILLPSISKQLEQCQH